MSNPKDIIIENLGPNVNTEFNEYSQVVTYDQTGIYFTARREGLGEVVDDGENVEMVMKSKMNDLDEWEKGNKVILAEKESSDENKIKFPLKFGN